MTGYTKTGLIAQNKILRNEQKFISYKKCLLDRRSRLTLYRLIYLSVIRELKKGLCIHANTSGSDSPTDPKLGSFSHNRMPLPGHSWLLRKIVCRQVSGGEKVEATLLFSVKHQKGKDTPTSGNHLHWNLAYFRQRQPPGCRPDHTQKVTGC